MATLVTLLSVSTKAVADSSTQVGSNRSRTTQRGGLQSGDAVGGGQVVSTAGSGTVTLNATNDSNGAIALSGDAGGSNQMSDVLVGSLSVDSTQAADAASPAGVSNTSLADDGVPHPADPVGPISPPAPSSEGSELPGLGPAGSDASPSVQLIEPTGPPGPIGPGTVQVGDNVLRYTQTADIRSGAAVAGGQVIASSQSGNVVIAATNQSTNSESISGDAGLDNSFHNVHVGALASHAFVGPVGPMVSGDVKITAMSAGFSRSSDMRSGATDPDGLLAAVRKIELEVAGPEAAAADIVGSNAGTYFGSVSLRKGPVGAFGPSN